MKSALTDIGRAVMDLIEAYGVAKDSGYVQKPISYSLYQTWRRWDEKEKPRKAGKRERGMKRTYDAKRFDGKCPYTDKPCYEWECDTCEIEAEEKKSMEELDRAESEEKE